MTKEMLTWQEVEKALNQAIDDLVSECGLPRAAQERKIYKSLFRNPSVKNAEKALGAIAADIIREHFQRQLKRVKKQRWTKDQLSLVLTKIKSYKRELPTALRKAIDGMKKILPRHGGPGRKEILSTTEKREACEHVSTLVKMGATRLPDTFQLVAEAFKAKGKSISSRTIKRAWEERQSLYVG
ncbi:MAG TPA: hypothetical protein VHF01_17885 [Candidatus Acidoferrum sp.]|nr:hypothetical protein [Candidatus Acidoferrum sp.]